MTCLLETRLLGGDTLEFEAFGAARYSVSEKLVATGHLGLVYVDRYGFTANGEFSFFSSIGAIYEIDPNLHLTAEFSGDTGNEAGYFTTGVDYEIIPNGRLRFGVGAGFGDGAPEYTVQGGFLYNFDGIGKLL